MADTTSAVNGLYGNQYGQPAELAANAPSAPAHASSASQSTTASATQKADPQEIGWYFVEQYYTTLSKSPDKIHLFYKKKSQLVAGREAEKVVPVVGEKAISEKIKALNIQDCKVRVLNVDSQSSFNNIVVQVIGEMSNKNQPHHKFVQTFVLAEQPNGFFVLNDIMRYLNDEEVDIVEDEVAQPEVPAEEPATPADDSNVALPTEDIVTSEAAVEQVDEKLKEEEKVEVPETTAEPVNGIDADTTADEPVADKEPEESVKEEEEPEAVATEAPVAETQEAPAAEAPPPKTAPIPEAPPAKKTWASMLGGNLKAQPAVPALPAQTATSSQAKPAKAASPATSAAPATTTAKSTPSEPAAAPPAQSNGWQTAEGGKKGRSTTQTKVPESNTLAYIKNVNDKVDARVLREVLEQYGELKYYDVSRPRNCAFVEFATPEGYAAAVAANPHTVGSEQIAVEERRPRPGAYGGPGQAPFARGNGTPGRGGRGNMQQRSGSHGAYPPKDGAGGRGGFQQRGGPKSGNVTPKGRGQNPAA